MLLPSFLTMVPIIQRSLNVTQTSVHHRQKYLTRDTFLYGPVLSVNRRPMLLPPCPFQSKAASSRIFREESGEVLCLFCQFLDNSLDGHGRNRLVIVDNKSGLCAPELILRISKISPSSPASPMICFNPSVFRMACAAPLFMNGNLPTFSYVRFLLARFCL